MNKIPLFNELPEEVKEIIIRFEKYNRLRPPHIKISREMYVLQLYENGGIKHESFIKHLFLKIKMITKIILRKK